MSTNGLNTSGDTDMADCDGEKVVTMMDVLQEQQDFEEDANAVLGASDDKNCTYTKGYIKRQALYACMTCCSDAKNDPSKRAGVCLACSLTCHENHELIELYTKRNFRCDCGNPKFNSHPCQFNPNKTELNEDNKYNQNYSGLYCICQRPYPDPESTVEDEMIQCIVCEDWLHASHLDAVVPSNDLYSEMICKNCMEKNEFLHDYSSIAVTADSVDVVSSDVTMSNDSTSNSLETPKEIKEQMNTTEANPECDDKGDTDVEMNDKTKITDHNGKTDEPSILNDEEKNQHENNSTDKEEEQKDESDTSNRKPLSEVDRNELTLENDKGESSTLSTNMEERLKEKEEITKLDTDMEENIKENEKLNELHKEDIVSKATLEETQETKDISNNSNFSSTTVNNSSEQNITEKENIVCDNKEDKNKEEEEKNVSKMEDTISETNDKDNNENSKDADDNTTEELKKESSPVLEEVRSQDVEDTTTCEVEDKTTTLTTNIEGEITADEQMTAKMEEDLLNEDADEGVTDKKYEDNLNESTKPQDPSIQLPPISDIEKSENSQLTIDHSDITQNTTDLSDESKTNDSEHKIESDTTNTELQDTGPENSTPVSEPEKEVISTESTKTSEAKEDNSLCPGNDDKTEPQKTENITQVNEISEENKTVEKVNDHKVSDDSKTNHSNIENEVPNEIELASANENKRKLSTEEAKEDVVAKRVKLEEVKTCVRPKGVKRQFKGATFWPSNFRQKLCTCNECLSMYKDLCVLFLIDPEDTVTAYETLGMEKTQGKPSSQYEKGLQALSSLDRIQQINALTEYNKMRDKLLDFLKSFKDRKEIVKEEDIKAFFAGMKPKREPDGVYFCR